MHWYRSVLANIHPMLICSQGEQEQQQLELISSTTKYEHIPDRSPPDGTSQNYADLELATGGAPPPPPPSGSKEKPVEYVELRQQPPIPPAVQIEPPSESRRREAAVKRECQSSFCHLTPSHAYITLVSRCIVYIDMRYNYDLSHEVDTVPCSRQTVDSSIPGTILNLPTQSNHAILRHLYLSKISFWHNSVRLL